MLVIIRWPCLPDEAEVGQPLYSHSDNINCISFRELLAVDVVKNEGTAEVR